MDVAFEVPDKQKPVVLEFKQNAAVDLAAHEAVKNTPEIERALAKKLLTRDATSWRVTALGHRYLNELLTLFMD